MDDIFTAIPQSESSYTLDKDLSSLVSPADEHMSIIGTFSDSTSGSEEVKSDASDLNSYDNKNSTCTSATSRVVDKGCCAPLSAGSPLTDPCTTYLTMSQVVIMTSSEKSTAHDDLEVPSLGSCSLGQSNADFQGVKLNASPFSAQGREVQSSPEAQCIPQCHASTPYCDNAHLDESVSQLAI